MAVQELFCAVVHILLFLFKDFTQFYSNLIQRYNDLLTIVTTYNHNLILLDIFWSNLDTCRNSEDLLLREFPSRALVGIINLHSVSGFFQLVKQSNSAYDLSRTPSLCCAIGITLHSTGATCGGNTSPSSSP